MSGSVQAPNIKKWKERKNHKSILENVMICECMCVLILDYNYNPRHLFIVWLNSNAWKFKGGGVHNTWPKNLYLKVIVTLFNRNEVNISKLYSIWIYVTHYQYYLSLLFYHDYSGICQECQAGLLRIQ